MWDIKGKQDKLRQRNGSNASLPATTLGHEARRQTEKQMDGIHGRHWTCKDTTRHKLGYKLDSIRDTTLILWELGTLKVCSSLGRKRVFWPTTRCPLQPDIWSVAWHFLLHLTPFLFSGPFHSSISISFFFSSNMDNAIFLRLRMETRRKRVGHKSILVARWTLHPKEYWCWKKLCEICRSAWKISIDFDFLFSFFFVVLPHKKHQYICLSVLSCCDSEVPGRSSRPFLHLS